MPKGSWLITGPSAGADSPVFMVVTEESNLQPVAGKLGATQGRLGRRAAFIDGLGSRRLCGRNLVNGPLGPLPPDSAVSPYLPATAQRVSRFIYLFFSLLSSGMKAAACKGSAKRCRSGCCGAEPPPAAVRFQSPFGSCPTSGIALCNAAGCWKRFLGFCDVAARSLTSQSLGSKVSRALPLASSPSWCWCGGAEGRDLAGTLP